MNRDKNYAIDLITNMKSNTISNYVIAGVAKIVELIEGAKCTTQND